MNKVLRWHGTVLLCCAPLHCHTALASPIITPAHSTAYPAPPPPNYTHQPLQHNPPISSPPHPTLPLDVQYQDLMLRFWEPAGIEAPATLDTFRQLFAATWQAVRSFEGRQHSSDGTTLPRMTAWMRALSAVLGLLCTCGALASAALPASLRTACKESAGWGLRVSGAILDLICALGADAAEGRGQLPGEPDAASLLRPVPSFVQAGLALLDAASLWEQLTQLLGTTEPFEEAYAAEGVRMASRARFESVAFHIWFALTYSPAAEAECEGAGGQAGSRSGGLKRPGYDWPGGPADLAVLVSRRRDCERSSCG